MQVHMQGCNASNPGALPGNITYVLYQVRKEWILEAGRTALHAAGVSPAAAGLLAPAHC